MHLVTHPATTRGRLALPTTPRRTATFYGLRPSTATRSVVTCAQASPDNPRRRCWTTPLHRQTPPGRCEGAPKKLRARNFEPRSFINQTNREIVNGPHLITLLYCKPAAEGTDLRRFARSILPRSPPLLNILGRLLPKGSVKFHGSCRPAKVPHFLVPRS